MQSAAADILRHQAQVSDQEMIKVKIISDSGIYPEYETEGSAGMDIRAYIDEPVKLRPGERSLVPTGLKIQLPPGYEAQIRARSGLAVKSGITLINAVGTIDSDYRGEIKVGLVNLSDEEHVIENGDRIAQMVIAEYKRAELEPARVLDETQRGSGGFGHTGTK